MHLWKPNRSTMNVQLVKAFSWFLYTFLIMMHRNPVVENIGSTSLGILGKLLVLLLLLALLLLWQLPFAYRNDCGVTIFLVLDIHETYQASKKLQEITIIDRFLFLVFIKKDRKELSVLFSSDESVPSLKSCPFLVHFCHTPQKPVILVVCCCQERVLSRILHLLLLCRPHLQSGGVQKVNSQKIGLGQQFFRFFK